MVKLAVKFQIYTKIIKVEKLTLVYDEIKSVLSILKTFPENFIVKYEDNDLGYIDLRSPNEMANSNRKSNILAESELAGEIVNTSTPNDLHNTSSAGSFSGKVFLIPILCKGISFMAICEDETKVSMV